MTKTHPFLVGDKVVLKTNKGRRKYGTVACLLPVAILIRWANGTTEQVSPALLTFNYGKR